MPFPRMSAIRSSVNQHKPRPIPARSQAEKLLIHKQQQSSPPPSASPKINIDTSRTHYRFFAGCAPKLEPCLLKDLHRLNLQQHGCVVPKRTDVGIGGIELHGPRQALWRVANQSRVAETIKIRVGPAFKATRFDDLSTCLSKLPWKSYLPSVGHPNTVPQVNVVCHKSKLYHSDAVRERVEKHLTSRVYHLSKKVVNEQREMPPDSMNVPVHIRFQKDLCQVSIDAVGDFMHHRYSSASEPKRVLDVSLRETLAAGCLALAEFQKGDHLWDPFCGSGTFLHEAVSLVAGKPLDRDRRFAFQNWRTHDEEQYQEFLDTIPPPDYSLLKDMHLIVSDIDANAVEAAKSNSDRLGIMSDQIIYVQGDFEEVAKRIPAHLKPKIVTHLPYGKNQKISKKQLHDLYWRFGQLLHKRNDFREVYVLSGNPDFARVSQQKWKTLVSFPNRGHSVEILKLQ